MNLPIHVQRTRADGALKKRARVIPPLGFRSSAFQPGAESKAEEFMSEKAQSPTVAGETATQTVAQHEPHSVSMVPNNGTPTERFVFARNTRVVQEQSALVRAAS